MAVLGRQGYVDEGINTLTFQFPKHLKSLSSPFVFPYRDCTFASENGRTCLENRSAQGIVMCTQPLSLCCENSRVQLFMAPRTIVCQAPLSMEFSRQEYWNSYFKGSFWPRDWTIISCISCIGRQILYHSLHLGSPSLYSCLNHPPFSAQVTVFVTFVGLLSES